MKKILSFIAIVMGIVLIFIIGAILYYLAQPGPRY